MGLTRSDAPLSAHAPQTVNYRIDGPAHKLLMHPFPRRVRAEFAGRTVLDTREGVLLHETALPPRLYVPETDIDASTFVPSDHTTHCPFKGDATYRSLQVGDRVVENALWAYPDPTAEALFLAAAAAQTEPADHEERLLAQRVARGQHAQLHGGVVQVEEAAHAPQQIAAQLGTAEQTVKQHRGRVLIVDDNTMAQTIFGHILQRSSYEVECVGNGVAAIDQASRSHFDAILMDLQMPRMDGFQTAKHIRELPAYVETPIIAITANCSKDYRDLCLKQGMQGFLAKPVQPRELVSTVEKFVQLSQALS